MPGVLLSFAASNTSVAFGASTHVCNSMGQMCPLWESSAVLLHFADGALIRLVCRATLQAQDQLARALILCAVSGFCRKFPPQLPLPTLLTVDVFEIASQLALPAPRCHCMHSCEVVLRFQRAAFYTMHLLLQELWLFLGHAVGRGTSRTCDPMARSDTHGEHLVWAHRIRTKSGSWVRVGTREAIPCMAICFPLLSRLISLLFQNFVFC